MDKKILIALGLIGAFSIDNATGMNGIIENPSVNESQSMKTINDFSYDLRSLGPVNRLFDLTYWSPQKWQEALHEVSEMVDFYWTHPDADMTSTAYTYYRLFVYYNVVDDFIKSKECDKVSLNTLTKTFSIATRCIGCALEDDAKDSYERFNRLIDEVGLRNAKLDSSYHGSVCPLIDILAYELFEKNT